MFFVQLYVHRRGVDPLPVHYVGKAATPCLLYGMPLLFLTTGDGLVADIATPLAWAFVIWGTGIYWWSAVLYAEQASAVLQGRRLEVTRDLAAPPSDASLSLLRRLVDDAHRPRLPGGGRRGRRPRPPTGVTRSPSRVAIAADWRPSSWQRCCRCVRAHPTKAGPGPS